MARILLLWLIFSPVLTYLATANAELESSPMAKTLVEPRSTSISDPPTSSASTSPEPESKSDESEFAEAPGIRRLGNHRHSIDSAAGGGVIVGGLVTVIFGAVFAYIRVTRRKSKDSIQNTT